MRLTRNTAKRRIKRAHKHTFPNNGCGIGCWICNPRFYGTAHKQDARNRADRRHMSGLE